MLTLTSFTPGEAERTTGLSTNMQRDWRFRGFLPKSDGHARFDLFDLSGMLAMKMLSDRGIGPQISRELFPWLSAGIAYSVLKNHEAYEGDHLRGLPPTFPGEDENEIIEGLRASLLAGAPDMTESDFRGFVEGLERTSRRNWSRVPRGWTRRCEGFAREVMRAKGFSFAVAPYFLWWADDTHVFTDDIKAAIENAWSTDPRLAGPIVVLDLHALAGLILHRAGRPFVHVDHGPDENPTDAPLEYGAPVPFDFNPDRPS